MHRRITITSMSNTAVNVIINTREKKLYLLTVMETLTWKSNGVLLFEPF